MATLTFNTTPDNAALSKLIDPRIAQKLTLVLGPLWEDKELAQKMTDPDIAQFIAGTAAAAAPGSQSMLDLAFVFGLFGAIAGFRNDDTGTVDQNGIRAAKLMLQPAMPNINELLKDKTQIDQIYLAPRAKLALQVVLEMIQLVEN